MGKKYSKKARLAIKGVQTGRVFAKIGASKTTRASIDAKTKRLITQIKRADTIARKRKGKRRKKKK